MIAELRKEHVARIADVFYGHFPHPSPDFLRQIGGLSSEEKQLLREELAARHPFASKEQLSQRVNDIGLFLKDIDKGMEEWEKEVDHLKHQIKANLKKSA